MKNSAEHTCNIAFESGVQIVGTLKTPTVVTLDDVLQHQTILREQPHSAEAYTLPARWARLQHLVHSAELKISGHRIAAAPLPVETTLDECPYEFEHWLFAEVINPLMTAALDPRAIGRATQDWLNDLAPAPWTISLIRICLDPDTGRVTNLPFANRPIVEPPFATGEVAAPDDPAVREWLRLFIRGERMDNRHAIALIRTSWQVMRIDAKTRAGKALSNEEIIFQLELDGL